MHGRIEEASFARYSYRKRRRMRMESGREELVVHAHLCEVAKAERPQESRRDPKWFSAEKAKRKLREGRADQDGAELARVIELAVMRVRRIQSATRPVVDNLQKVKFDAFEIAGTPPPLQHAAIRRYVRRETTVPDDQWRNARVNGAQRLLTGKILPLKPKNA